MKKTIKIIKSQLKKYNISKLDKEIIYDNLIDLYDESTVLSNEQLKIDIKKIMIENDIYEREEIKLSSILLSFLLIIFGISLFFNPISTTLFIGLLLVIFSISMYESKNTVLSCLTLIIGLIFLNNEFDLLSFYQLWTITIASTFVIIGLKLLFKEPSKKQHSEKSHTISTNFGTKTIKLRKQNNIKIEANFSTVVVDTTEFNFNEEFLIIHIENLCSDVKLIVDESTYVRSNIASLESLSATIHPANKIIISGKNTFGKIIIQKGK